MALVKHYNIAKCLSHIQRKRLYHAPPQLSNPALLNEKMNRSVIMTFNNPRYLNAMSPEMLSLLNSSLKACEENKDNIDMVFLRGTGNVMSSGGDIKMFIEGAKNPKNRERLHKYIDDAYRALYRSKTTSIPNISIMNGLAVGIAAGICFGTNFRVATEKTALMMPETRIGHFCDVSSCYHLSRLDGYYGRYLALCAERSKAEDLKHCGIATHFVPSGRVDDMVHHLTTLESPSVDVIDQELDKFTEALPTDPRLTTSNGISQQEKHQVVEHCFKFDTVEEIIDALEQEGSKFSLSARDKILLGSPSAVKITLELYRRASCLSYTDCLLLERKLWSIDMDAPDFVEGCMSMLEKRSPVWFQQQLDQVDLKVDIHTKRFDAAEPLEPIDLRV
ncbi:hypothetical protein [Parasitella parasitica]|uniref:3-hydroxyisobutyryl-CoA hydrolase n=1 Tax=Parasitella parasitica TaxID=35722 RepID=A0A0B7NWB1_9FUNG|nr:hypothetical protein [Parasitella parasitica]